MAKESPFVDSALELAQSILLPPLSLQRSASLLYQIAVDNELSLTVDPKSPRRGTSAFQTDLCVFETKRAGIVIPRVVLEFKTRITTHDVLTYSTKARKHKQVYPYLRYGLVMSEEPHIAGRVFNHNEALDFAVAVGGYSIAAFKELLAHLLNEEIAASRELEAIFFGSAKRRLFRSAVVAS
ncbi:hypothetical protein GCM10009105_10630 [Dokdonella soli]|uniref:TnsA endonuclease N-terminal domain-containing protein n=2 Tax=Dokdonella soli TaxID=529810 RepID=A0ABN1IE45_9GAMM